MKKYIFSLAGVAIVAGLAWGICYINSLLPIITGHSAKYICSAVFISHRQPTDVEATELDFSFLRYTDNVVNYQEKSVTSHFLWGKSKAIYREGFGSTLLRDGDESGLREKKFPSVAGTGYNQESIAWPMGNIVPETNPRADLKKLGRVADNLMSGHGYHGNPFAFLVVHNGIPVVERYKPGFDARTRFLSWSMAKSFTNALVGIMVRDGKFDIHQKADIPTWQQDERKQITINDLMQMQSGLQWNEEYGNRSDVTLMLYNSRDFAAYTYNQPREFPAGSHWYYSSGSTNIVQYLMRKQFKNDDDYYAYVTTRLFYKIGMPDAVFETDPTGTLVGSSYIYATARDYARFGLLYLQDGIFNGERILPEGWVDYSTSPAKHSNGNYGSFFWLNKGKYYPAAPEDLYFCNGVDGQRILIIPSKNLVVVVLGYSPKPDNDMNFNQLIPDVLDCLKR